jgi:hypothetical protein
MHRAIGVILIILALAVIQFSGLMIWHRGGIDVADLGSFRWLSNIGGRMRGDAALFIGVGIIGIIMLFGGFYKAIRGKKREQSE